MREKSPLWKIGMLHQDGEIKIIRQWGGGLVGGQEAVWEIVGTASRFGAEFMIDWMRKGINAYAPKPSEPVVPPVPDGPSQSWGWEKVLADQEGQEKFEASFNPKCFYCVKGETHFFHDSGDRAK